MQRRQGIQNMLCRTLTRTHHFSSITGPLKSLHLLPVKSRVQFKITLLTYIIYKNKYLAYFEDRVQSYKSIYHTRRRQPAPPMLTVPHYNSRVIMLTNPKTIARKRFIEFSNGYRSREQHI